MSSVPTRRRQLPKLTTSSPGGSLDRPRPRAGALDRLGGRALDRPSPPSPPPPLPAEHRVFVRQLPTPPCRRPSVAHRRRPCHGSLGRYYEHLVIRRYATPDSVLETTGLTYEHLGGYAMHELRDFNRHPRWHDDQWRVPTIVTCRLHGNSVLTEARDGSVFVTML